MTVERIALAPGLEIARVAVGMWQIADMERSGPVDEAAAVAAMARHAEAGLTTFDMADHYGSAEALAGRFRSGLETPELVQLLTKWVPPPGPIRAADARAAVERALRRLGGERIDLFQLHAWRYADPSWLDALFALDAVRREGLIRCLGVTNVDTAHLDLALKSGIEIVSNQVSFSLLDRRACGAMSALCARAGVRLLAFGTLAGGLLTERWLGQPAPAGTAPGTWSEMKYRRYVDAVGGWDALQELLRALDAVARRLDASMANVACRWVLDQPAVAAAIVGARLGEREHVADTLRIFDLALDADARSTLDAAAAALEPLPGDCGDEYRRAPFLTATGDLSDHLDAPPPPPYPVIETGGGKRRVVTGTAWERIAGYCRAVRCGDRIVVAGTTAVHGERLIGGDDPAAQTHFILDKIDGALASLGSSLADVVRTRVFIRHLEDWEAVARAHGERFRDVLPVNTLVQAAAVGEDYLVEIEAEAIVPSGEAAPNRG